MSVDPDLKKLSDRKLADMFGIAKKQLKAETRHVESLTAELVRRGKQVYAGSSYTVLKVPGEQLRFDTEAVKIEMGVAWYDARRKVVSTVSWVPSQKEIAGLQALPPTK